MAIRCDVLVVGAGPAGATTALFLAQRGIPHLLLDQATFPRDKVCGDGLDLKVVRVLRHLDPDILHHELAQNAHFAASWGTRFILPNGRQLDLAHRPDSAAQAAKPLFWTAKRLHFDDFLVQKLDPLYTDFRQGIKVERIERRGKLWHVEARSATQTLEISTPLLIGADGDHSVVLRSLGARRVERAHYAGTLRQYWRGVEGMAPDNLIEVYFPKGYPMSYFYVFPLPGGEANVGYGMVSSRIAQGRHHLRDIFQRILREDPVMAPRFAKAEPLETPVGWGLPLASLRRPASGDGYLLVGDAASLVCPTSGEGIGTGMISGFIAAAFAERALMARDFSAGQFRHYDREVYRRLREEIKLYEWVVKMPPTVYENLLGTVARLPFLQTVFRQKARGWLRTAYEKPIEIAF